MKKDLFRAKLKESGEWVYWDAFGHLCRESGKQQNLVIKTKHGEMYYRYVNDIECRIDRNTVCKWIGLFDKNGKRIFEGDLIRHRDRIFGEVVGVIEYDDGCFCVHTLRSPNSHAIDIVMNESEVEIIGNIYDNPELLKGE